MSAAPTTLAEQVRVIDQDIAELEAMLAEKRAERDALQAQVQQAISELQGLLPTGKRGVGRPFGGRALTDDQVRDIRRDHKQGSSAYGLSQRYGVSAPVIQKIIKRETYADVLDTPPSPASEGGE